MSDATAIRLVWFGSRILMVSLILLGPKLWPWLPGRVPERGSTFFGVRVPPGFAGSGTGRDILRIFRRRLWISTFALAGIFAVAAPNPPSVMFLWYMGAVLSTWLSSWVLYSVAQRRTSIEAGPVSEPSVRTAALLQHVQPQPRWTAFAAWTVMILPVAAPLITGILLAVNWSRYPARLHPELVPPQIAIAACFGLLMTGLQFALRFGARASDWAATPEASLKYRTHLGLMMGTASLAPILLLCSQALGPLLGGFLGTIWFGVQFLVLFALLGFVYRMRSKLVKLFEPQSGDPMADHCWKWTSFYYNPSDPAWVVPTRSGTTCSLNHARPMVWAAYVLATAGALVAVLQITRLMPELIRAESVITKSLH